MSSQLTSSRAANSIARTPSRRGKRSRRSTPSINGDATAPRTPSKLRTSTTSIPNDDADESANAFDSPKRRRIKEREASGTYSREKAPPSGASTASNGTGDETLLRDLEDELEAALGGSDTDVEGAADGGTTSDSPRVLQHEVEAE